MVSEGRRFMQDQWWMATFPGLAVLAVSLGFNLIGDGLRDVMDPRA
jgi:peptide/nickel transport system permease protein